MNNSQLALNEAVQAMKHLKRMPSAEWEAKYPSFARECANSALAPK